MSANKTAWHPPFTGLLQERGPKWTKITGEVSLTMEPQRADDVIEVRVDRPRDPSDAGSVLRLLWGYIVWVALLEFKSIARPFRRGDLLRLLGYGMAWLSAHQAGDALPVGPRTRRRATPADLTLVLVVPSVTPTLQEELRELSLTVELSKTGYHEVRGFPVRLVAVDLGVAAEHERDELMRWFAGVPGERSLEALRWIGQHTGGARPMSAQAELEGWEEWARRYFASLTPDKLAEILDPAQRLAGLDPAQRLAGLDPAQRLAGLDPVQTVLALPDEVLRGLSDEYVATLPSDIQATVRIRRGR